MESSIKLPTASPLGNLSTGYLTKQPTKNSIWDQPDIGVFQLYPSAYSQNSGRDHCNRQETLRILYEAAIVKGTENQQYPFGKEEHSLEIYHDHKNYFDKNALHIILHVNSGPLLELDGKDLGFIPKHINLEILCNIKTIGEGKIYKVVRDYQDKFYVAKVIFPYGTTRFCKEITSSTRARLKAILEE